MNKDFIDYLRFKISVLDRKIKTSEENEDRIIYRNIKLQLMEVLDIYRKIYNDSNKGHELEFNNE